jgi:hypothetical protein
MRSQAPGLRSPHASRQAAKSPHSRDPVGAPALSPAAGFTPAASSLAGAALSRGDDEDPPSRTTSLAARSCAARFSSPQPSAAIAIHIAAVHRHTRLRSVLKVVTARHCRTIEAPSARLLVGALRARDKLAQDMELMAFGGISCAVIGSVVHTYGVAKERDRTPILWAGLAAAVAVLAAVASWTALAGSIASGSNVVGLSFAAMAGPILAPIAVTQVLRRLSPGRPRVPGSLAVRLMGKGGQALSLRLAPDGLRFEGEGTARHIPRGELGRVEADGECLILSVRSTGEELRVHVLEFTDPWRRRRMSVALAAALTGGVPRATARPAR